MATSAATSLLLKLAILLPGVAYARNPQHSKATGALHAGRFAQQANVSYPFALISTESGVHDDSRNQLKGERFTQEDPKYLFCWIMVFNPPEKTFDLIHEMLQQCDTYRVYSNFSDTSRNITAVPEIGVFAPSEKSQVNYRHVWSALARDPEVHDYKWIMKVEPDTVFYPKAIKRALLQDGIDYTKLVGLGSFRGPSEIVSQGAFRAFVANMDRCTENFLAEQKELKQEDWFMGECAEKVIELQSVGLTTKIADVDERFHNFETTDQTFAMMTSDTDIVPLKKPREFLDRRELRKEITFHPLKSRAHMKALMDWLDME
uniref:N-acetylgalactosaminide beta-1,3-galactosyltransferase n=2 Tax=Lotharella globosa TaxID=91324 RepID=A0A7S4DJS9_9EUKA